MWKHEWQDNTFVVESNLHMGQESNLPKAAQKFSGSLLHHPEDNLGSEEDDKKKDFQGD